VRPLTLSAVVFLSAVALVPAPQGRDEGQFTLAVDVDLVVFNVTVTDRSGQTVPKLEADAFDVFEDDRPQEVTLFRPGDVPASIGLVIDSSGSMGQRHAEVVRAAIAFASASNPEDELFVLNFNERAWFGLPPSIPFTRDLDQLRVALTRSAPSGMTALNDALVMALDHLKRGTRDRRALVVLSDGGDNASRVPADKLFERLRASIASVYTIGIYDEMSNDRNPGMLRRVAEMGAGRAYFPDSSDDILEVWHDVADQIRSQYTIGYHSSNPVHDGQFRKVRITAKGDRDRPLRVTARSGYFAPTLK
jgi:Ca-activated chloride channel homolog